MRKRNEIERDFNKAMGIKKNEFFEYQRKKIIIEVMLDIRELLKDILESK